MLENHLALNLKQNKAHGLCVMLSQWSWKYEGTYSEMAAKLPKLLPFSAGGFKMKIFTADRSDIEQSIILCQWYYIALSNIPCQKNSAFKFRLCRHSTSSFLKKGDKLWMLFI